MKRIVTLLVLALFVIPIAYSAVKLTVNGVQYNYPQSGDIDWGDQATQWASAVSNGTLQKTGGTFTLTQEASFGALYGVKSKYYKSLATNVASSGILRLGNGETLAWRDSGNTADLPLYTSGNLLMFGSDTLATAAQTVELTNKTIDGLKNVITNISPGAVANLTDLNIDASANIQWSKINKTGSSIADLTTRSAGDLTSGTVDNARLSSDVVLKDASQTLTMKTISGSTNTISDIQPGSFSSGAISNADINGSAAIEWTKIDKTGSNITDIATRSHTSLSDIGTTTHADIDSHIGSVAAHGVLSTVVGSTETQVLTNKDIDGGTASNTSRITIPKNTKANLDTLTRKEGTIVYATDESKAYIDNGSALAEVGSGSAAGDIENLIINPTAETSGKVASDTWTCTNATATISTGNAASPTHNFVLTATSAGGYCETSFTTLAGRVNHDSYFYYKTTASDVTLGVYLGANLQNSATLTAKSAVGESSHATFITDGTAQAGKLRVTFPTDGTVFNTDDLYAGLNQNIGSVAQAEWVGKLVYGSDCTYQINSATYSTPTDASCTITAYGDVSAASGDKFGFILNSPKNDGVYKAVVTGDIYVNGAATDYCSYKMTDGTNVYSEQLMKQPGSAQFDFNQLIFSAKMPSAASQFEFQMKESAGYFCGFSGNGTSEVNVYYYPTSSQTAVRVGTETLTGWTNYTPTTQGFGSITNSNFQWRRVGDSIELRGTFTTGTVSTTEARVYFPSSVGNALLPDSVTTVIKGSAARGTSAAGGWTVLVHNGANYIRFGAQNAADGGVNSKNASDIFNSSDTVSFYTTGIPISGWVSSYPMPVIVNSVTHSKANQQRIVAGQLNDSCAVNFGTGDFTSSQVSSGKCTVTLTTPFNSSQYMCTCTPAQENRFCSLRDDVTARTASSFTFSTRADDGSASAVPADFICIGDR